MGDQERAGACEDGVPNVGDLSDSRCVVLRFHRHNREMKHVLEQSELGRHLADRGQDLCPDWANGAKVLVPGLGPAGMALAGLEPGSLRAWNVVVREDQQHAVLAALDSLPYRRRPRAKRRNNCAAASVSSERDPDADLPALAQDGEREQHLSDAPDQPSTGSELELHAESHATPAVNDCTVPYTVQHTFVHIPVA